MANKEISIDMVTHRTPVPTAQPGVIRRQPMAQQEVHISAVDPVQQNGQEMSFDFTSGNDQPANPSQEVYPSVTMEETPSQPQQPVKRIYQAAPVIRQPKGAPVIKMQQATEPPKERIVDPSQIVFKKPGQDQEQQMSRSHMEDMAFTAFDDMITRKKKEASDALRRMEEVDQKNRLAVAEGLEEVNNEIVYMDPNHNGKGKEGQQKQMTPEEEEDKFDEELERDMNDMDRTVEAAVAAHGMPNKNMRVINAPTQPEQSVQVLGGMQAPEQPEQPSMEKLVTQETVMQQEAVQQYAPSPEDFDPTQYQAQPEQQAVVKSQPNEAAVPVTPVQQEEDPDVEEYTAPSVATGVKYVTRNEEPVQEVKKDINKDDFDLDPEDFKDIEDDGSDTSEDNKLSKEEEELVKAGNKNLKNEILQKIVGSARKLDVSTFTVSKRTASLAEVLARSRQSGPVKSTASWPLMNLGRPFIASSLTGPEIAMMQSIDEQNSNFWANLQQLTIIYNHDQNPYKPSTVEGWMKTIPYSDIDELFMAIFCATYGNANYLPYECTFEKCHNMELKLVDKIREKMVDFENDAQKEKFEQIMNTPVTPDNSIEYETVIVPINDVVAIGFKLPSLYNMIIELRSVNRKFVQKYASVITIMSFIDEIYSINPETNAFDPIDYKRYPGDAGKTFKSKIAAYAKILHTLTPNEFNVLSVYLGNLQEKSEVLKYVIPEDKCTKCGHTIEKQTASGKSLVFTQQQLVTFATTTEE